MASAAGWRGRPAEERARDGAPGGAYDLRRLARAGAAIACRRGRWSLSAPPACVAAAMVLALVTVRLPGHGTTGALAVAASVAVSRPHALVAALSAGTGIVDRSAPAS